jgi:hypothetical protein
MWAYTTTCRTNTNGDEDVNQCPLTYGQRSTLKNDAGPPHQKALTHRHARPSCGLKDIINALIIQRRTFLVSPRTDILCDTLCLCPRNISVNIRVITRRTQICLAADEDYRDKRTYGPYYLDPLIIKSVMMISLNRVNLHLKAAYLNSNVLQ